MQKPGATKSSAGKPGAGKPVKKAGAKKSAAGSSADSKPAEPLLSDEAVDEKAIAFLGEENVNNLANSNWKERLAAMENFDQVRAGGGSTFYLLF